MTGFLMEWFGFQLMDVPQCRLECDFGCMKHFSCARSDLINDPSTFVTSCSQVNLRAFKQLELLPVSSKL